MGISRLSRIFRNQGSREALRVLLSGCLNRLNGDNNGDPAANGEFALLRAFLKPGMVVVDVGSNIGDWARQALAIEPALQIYAFEPISHLFEALQTNLHGRPVVFANAALSDQIGEVDIYIDGDWSKSNSFFCRDFHRGGRKETINKLTGDAFVAEHRLEAIDFLKIDVEGAELKVLQGFRQTFARRQIDLCQLEYGATYLDAGILLRDIFSFAEEIGYGVAKLLPNELRLFKAYDYTLECFKYANYLLYRDSKLLPDKLLK
jgi:FkbM family methyltransferase